MAGDAELTEAHSELQAVKRALRDGSAHLGLRGESLQRYLLQLGEKENLLLSRQLYRGAASNGQAIQHKAYLLGASSSAAAIASSSEGPSAHRAHGSSAQAADAAAVGAAPREPPPGPAQTFNKNDLASVLSHMCGYEAVALESVKAMRALASLAYSDAAFNLDDSRVLGQLQRLMAIHQGEPQVQLAAMRALCNMAYDPDSAVKRLISPSLLAGILKSMDGHPNVKDLAVKASEAAARLIAAEACPVGEAASDGGPVRSVEPSEVEGLGALGGFFAAAAVGESACQRSVLHLAAQLLSSEVVAPALIAQRFVAASKAVRRRGPEGAAAAWGWLNLARLLCDPTLPSELGEAMVQAGCIAVSANLMVDQARDAPTQVKGIEAMSAIIGDRWAGLHAFAEVGGIALVVAAMRAHGGDARVQTKGVKALSCGIQWPQDLQAKAGYSYGTGIELTKSAMAQHPDRSGLRSTRSSLSSTGKRTAPSCKSRASSRLRSTWTS